MKNGALFSKSLFGYRRKDVIEYIRTVDVDHADEISRINSEKGNLQDRLECAESKISELENLLDKERAAYKEKIQKIIAEYDKKIEELINSVAAQKDKLSDSENRAATYLKLVDSSSLRAENAEAELAVLSANIEDYKNEIAELRSKLVEMETEVKKASDFDALAKKLLENNNEKRKTEHTSVFSIFKKSRHRK
jgi:chromosome segregation ATPase